MAGGSSTRFGAVNKLFAPLCGKPLLAWSLEAFLQADSPGAVIIVTSERSRREVSALTAPISGGRSVKIVAGGARRRDSVEAGLVVASTDYVAVHDGARPLVTPDIIRRVRQAAFGHAGATAALPVADTIKVVGADGLITGHPDRALLWAAQTPQVFRRDLWLQAAALSDDDVTDDMAMLDRLGVETIVVEGDAGNLKVTRPMDLALAQAILRERDAACTE